MEGPSYNGPAAGLGAPASCRRVDDGAPSVEVSNKQAGLWSHNLQIRGDMPEISQVVCDNFFHSQAPGNFRVDVIVNNSALNSALTRLSNHGQTIGINHNRV